MKGLPSSCSPAAQNQELYYWVLIAGPPLPPLSLTTHSKLSPWSELDLYPCSLEDLHQLSLGLSHHLLTTGLYPASFSPLHVGETTPMGSPMESPTTQLSTRKGDMHDSISQHWGAKETPNVPNAFQSKAPQPSRHHIWKQAGNSNQAPLLGNVSNPPRDFVEAGNPGEGG